jgi:GAF domain-containing protein
LPPHSRSAAPHELNEVLQRIVEGAAAVAGAHFSALGVYGDDGRITTFVHHGFDEATVAQIGHLPEVRGLLGQVIVADRPIRLVVIGDDPQSAGVPPGHPPMHSFLGVPVVQGGRRSGSLYVTERHDGASFDDDDEALVVALAAFAAGAVESAELVEAERSRAEARLERVAAEEQARARRELLGQTIAAQEAERARVSRDLHDDVGQALTPLRVTAPTFTKSSMCEAAPSSSGGPATPACSTTNPPDRRGDAVALNEG